MVLTTRCSNFFFSNSNFQFSVTRVCHTRTRKTRKLFGNFYNRVTSKRTREKKNRCHIASQLKKKKKNTSPLQPGMGICPHK